MRDSIFNQEMTPILGYFKLRGWAGPIRLLLAYLEADYVEKFYQLPVPESKITKTFPIPNYPANNEVNWSHEKHSLGLPFPNLPYWIEGNVKLTETKAIMKHIARTRNPALLGQSENEKANVNMIEEVLWDMWNSLCQTCLKYDDEVTMKFMDDTKTKLELLSKNFTEGWIAGSNITVADFLLYEVLYHYNTFFSKSLLRPYPPLQNFMGRFDNIPQIAKYINTKEFIKGPCFSAKFKARL